MKRSIFLKNTLMTILTLSLLSLFSCSKDDEPKSENQDVIGNGIIVIGDNQFNVRYGYLDSHIQNGTKEYLLYFRSYTFDRDSHIIPNPQNKYVVCSVIFKTEPEKILKPGEEWEISSLDYDLTIDIYSDESLSLEDNSLFLWQPTILDLEESELISGNMSIKRVDDSYIISIDNLAGVFAKFDDGEMLYKRWETGRFSWSGPLNIEENN